MTKDYKGGDDLNIEKRAEVLLHAKLVNDYDICME
jgi:hypothetical protein